METTSALYAASLGCYFGCLAEVSKENARQRSGDTPAADDTGRRSSARRRQVALAAFFASLLGALDVILALAEPSAPAIVGVGDILCVVVALLGLSYLAADALLPDWRAITFDKALTSLFVKARTFLLVGALGVGVAYVLILLPSALPQNAHLGGVFFTGGTCADLDCGLRQRVQPNIASSYARAPLLPDGTKVYVQCQAVGSVVRLRYGGHVPSESNIWDRLHNGRYVSDLFVDTSKHGELDSAIPQCPKN